MAVALGGALGGVVINADALQLYRELAVLTARPTLPDIADVPHRLFGVLGCAEAASAARWAALARAEARAAWASGRLPILAGGTGLYIAVFLDGLAPVPDVPADVRAVVRERLGRLGARALHAELARRDPAGAAALRPSDSQRVARATEVLEATGRPLSWWRARPRDGGHRGRSLELVLEPPRDRLYAACDRRFGRMLAHGAIDEAAAVMGLGLGGDRPCLKALGLGELGLYLRGRISLAEAGRRARQATRNYAKRQATWFRHQLNDAVRLAEPRPADTLRRARELAARFAVDRPRSCE